MPFSSSITGCKESAIFSPSSNSPLSSTQQSSLDSVLHGQRIRERKAPINEQLDEAEAAIAQALLLLRRGRMNISQLKKPCKGTKIER
mmetsp:Transcript_16926/g.25056  ORF Transcript_16926/g.25056 Transcript_16926/m.25056 type:complete len:88 (-) Transcript_16926:1088-1351(-)